jgi:A/G-specific adenine glycosylase
MHPLPLKQTSDVLNLKKLLRQKGLTPVTIRLFRKVIYDFYAHHARNWMLWRKTKNPFHILVSEVMLQQTQVERVIDKYKEFLSIFPDFSKLAKAPLHKVLTVWQGLGYNRRALALHTGAKQIVKEYRGILPSSAEELEKLPGIGRATASAIVATASAIVTYAFNKPEVFIETNIRRVFIHFFFQNEDKIRDNQILPLAEKTLDRENTRKWYFALTDYGAMLGKHPQNPNRKSAHYQRQSPFEGSHRQLRGKVLREIMASRGISETILERQLKIKRKKLKEILYQLQNEGFIQKKGKQFSIDS